MFACWEWTGSHKKSTQSELDQKNGSSAVTTVVNHSMAVYFWLLLSHSKVPPLDNKLY